MFAAQLKRQAFHYLKHAGRKAERDLHAGERHGRHFVHHLERGIERSLRKSPVSFLMAALGIGVLTGILLTLSCPASFPELHRDR